MGVSIDNRSIQRLLLRRATRKTKGYSTIVRNGLLYWEFAEHLVESKPPYLVGFGLINKCEYQAALNDHPIAALKAIENAREMLPDDSKHEGEHQREFETLERAWLAKAAVEQRWLSGYLSEDGCASAAFYARLRLAELLWETPKGSHYLQLARDLCASSSAGAARTKVLEAKVKELSAGLSSEVLIVCSGKFSDQDHASERDANQLKHYSVLQKPLPFVCMERPVESIKAVLNAQYPWMANVTQHFTEQLQTQILLGNPRIALRPTLLVGEPGIGKNHYLNMFSKELGLPSQLIAVGGSSDNRALVGTARGYLSGRPSQILTTVVERRVPNPLIILDEIEKEGSGSNNGRMTDTLHQLLEKGNACRWYDEFLLAECDLSWVNWIACANSLTGLPDSLLSRFEVVRVSPPAPDDMYSVVYGAMKDIAVRNNQPLAIMPKLTSDCWELLEDCFKRGHSPRMVAKVTERLVAALLISESGSCAH